MMEIPSDPVMLMSYINTKLRDDYLSIHALCDDLELDEQALCDRLHAAGFDYDEAQNRFW